MEDQVKGYCSDTSREEEEEDQEIIAAAAAVMEESSSRRLQQEEEEEDHEDGAVGNLDGINEEEEIDLMELRLGGGSKSKGREEGEGILGCSNSNTPKEEGVVAAVVVEKEHMFDKVVTPSDVGKLNRLVIPKQHAEKYFPLDSSSNEKGLLLNFEDRNGKMWRFRYSYWNSSQSYVMTKGWSRFVKDKKLDAGDIVSFHRGRPQLYRHRLYIDWRPRTISHHHLLPPPPNIPFYLSPNHSSLYSHLPNPNYAAHPQYYNYNFFATTLHHQQQYHHPAAAAASADHLNPLYYLTSSPITPSSATGGDHQQESGIIDSVPVGHHRGGNINTSGKRLRLFGVNMECDSSSSSSSTSATTSGDHHHHDRVGTNLALFDNNNNMDPSNSHYGRQ